MEKLTNKQKNVIYEQLLALDCPDLLAALIAERCVTIPAVDHDVCEILRDGFLWSESTEGWRFWEAVYDCACDKEWEELDDAYDCARDVVSEPSVDFSLPSELDFAPKGAEAKIDIIKPYPLSRTQVTKWAKVKFFFAKLFYKV